VQYPIAPLFFDPLSAGRLRVGEGLARLPLTQKAAGSSPVSPAILFRIALDIALSRRNSGSNPAGDAKQGKEVI